MVRKSSRIALGALLLPILLALAIPAHAMGSRENPLTVADSLIKEKKLDDAVLVLTEYIKDNPDRFDQAQKRLREIVKIREAFNAAGEKLLKAYEEKPTDYTLHEKLINDLREILNPDDPEVKKFVDEAEKTALFNLNRGRLYGDHRGRPLADDLGPVRRGRPQIYRRFYPVPRSLPPKRL